MVQKGIVLKQIVTFLIITSLISVGIYIWMFNSAKEDMGVVLLMMWTPAISAVLTSLIHKDKIGNYGWKLGKARFLVYSFILPIGISLIAYGLVWISGLADVYGEEVMNYRWARMLGFQTPVTVIAGLLSKMFLGFLLTFILVLGEEIGWSGFLTPKLSKVSSVPVTSLIVGGYWAIWHYPAIIGNFYGYGTPLWIALPGFTLVVIGSSFLRTVLRLKSGSLWVGVILHASDNVYLMGIFHDITVKKEYIDYLISETGMFMGIVYIIVAIIFWKNQMKKTITVES
jgi:membrane protease YdiL (CAAX protease family)